MDSANIQVAHGWIPIYVALLLKAERTKHNPGRRARNLGGQYMAEQDLWVPVDWPDGLIGEPHLGEAGHPGPPGGHSPEAEWEQEEQELDNEMEE